MTVSALDRQILLERANYRCEYCYAPAVIGISLETDHLKPRVLGGEDHLDNLCAACSLCNNLKAAFTTGFDLETQAEYPLFNPRLEVWSAHFQWTEDSLALIGLTPVGRVTIDCLKLNDPERQLMRHFWRRAKLHPPP